MALNSGTFTHLGGVPSTTYLSPHLELLATYHRPTKKKDNAAEFVRGFKREYSMREARICSSPVKNLSFTILVCLLFELVEHPTSPISHIRGTGFENSAVPYLLLHFHKSHSASSPLALKLLPRSMSQRRVSFDRQTTLGVGSSLRRPVASGITGPRDLRTKSMSKSSLPPARFGDPYSSPAKLQRTPIAGKLHIALPALFPIHDSSPASGEAWVDTTLDL
ncbi:hypothetical protein C8R44DRAFT_891242 [Mycena epipterygia]|nr:hypothetical protein C8R44DRAFT_891242 [Mycena epipterygia]